MNKEPFNRKSWLKARTLLRAGIPVSIELEDGTRELEDAGPVLRYEGAYITTPPDGVEDDRVLFVFPHNDLSVDKTAEEWAATDETLEKIDKLADELLEICRIGGVPVNLAFSTSGNLGSENVKMRGALAEGSPFIAKLAKSNHAAANIADILAKLG